jgi:hypothetical protein
VGAAALAEEDPFPGADSEYAAAKKVRRQRKNLFESCKSLAGVPMAANVDTLFHFDALREVLAVLEPHKR